VSCKLTIGRDIDSLAVIKKIVHVGMKYCKRLVCIILNSGLRFQYFVLQFSFGLVQFTEQPRFRFVFDFIKPNRGFNSVSVFHLFFCSTFYVNDKEVLISIIYIIVPHA